MTCRDFRSIRIFAAASIAIAAVALSGAPASAQAFICSGETYIIQGDPAQLTEVDQTGPMAVFTDIGTVATGSNINNIGFNKADGLIYGYRRTPPADVDIVSMGSSDGAGTLTVVDTCGASPGDLPCAASVEYNSGDISPDGTFMYFNSGGSGAFHTYNLMTSTNVNTCTVSGGTGTVADWAAHPTNGMLYGGDSTDGELAVIIPGTCVRTDMTLTPALPTAGAGAGFGAAWFDGAGTLYLYQNDTDGSGGPGTDGQIYSVDISGLTSAAEDLGPTSGFNDGAACIQDLLGVAKDMSSSAGNALPSTITIVYTFENFSGSDTLTDMTAIEDLAAVFGTHGVDWTFTSISSAPTAAFANASFNGHSVTQLINQAPTQSLGPGVVETITVTFELLTHAAAVMDTYTNQVTGMGTFGGLVYSDISDDGTDPDQDMDGNASDDRDPSILTVPVELMRFSVD